MTNEVLNTMKTRRSCRCYLDKMPEPEALNAVLEAGTWAPTGMGRQSPVIVCIQNKADRDTLSKMNAAAMGGNGDPFYGAPCVAVVLVDKTIPTCVEDGSLVMGNMLNAAESVGLSACWIHRAKEMFETAEGQALLKKWGVPNAENLRRVGSGILGRAAGGGLSGGSAGGAAPGRNPVASAGHRRGLVRRAAAVPGGKPRRGAGTDHGGRPLRRGGADGDGAGSASPVSHIEGPLRRGGAVPPSAAGIRRVHRAEPGDGAGAGVCPHGL